MSSYSSPSFSMAEEQLSLWGYNADHAATWSPRELWLKLDRSSIEQFKEDKRIERKSAMSVRWDQYSEYLSMWSNTVEGGIMLYGVEDNGAITGCAHWCTGHIVLAGLKSRLSFFQTDWRSKVLVDLFHRLMHKTSIPKEDREIHTSWKLSDFWAMSK
ncbi:helix-turn-helix domain-containing protein [Parasphingorhabdus sp.]|uniref:AlbA family DNA-binding domain-containing protein n=1 Tax=Parasphingorhabdus sp. TaxID=2709688 RepID=UPI0035933842